MTVMTWRKKEFHRHCMIPCNDFQCNELSISYYLEYVMMNRLISKYLHWMTFALCWYSTFWSFMKFFKIFFNLDWPEIRMYFQCNLCWARAWLYKLLVSRIFTVKVNLNYPILTGWSLFTRPDRSPESCGLIEVDHFRYFEVVKHEKRIILAFSLKPISVIYMYLF